MFPQFLGIALLLGQPAADPTALINRELAHQWQAQKLTPADKTHDLEFLRRASLDLLGRIPTVPEQEAYLKEPTAQRRHLLIDRLLAHSDYSRHSADTWSDWLMGSAGDPDARAAFHRWLEKHFASNGSHKELAEKLLTAKGSTHHNPAGHFLAVHRGAAIPEKDWEKLGQYDMVPATGKAFRIFHARRLECVHCHDSPFDVDMYQHQFFSMNVFFRQVRFSSKSVGKKKDPLELDDDLSLNKPGFVPMERRNGMRFFAGPKFYDSEQWKPAMKQTRREFFADRFVKHPDFARGVVNFTWARLFGHGLTQSLEYDDIGAHNPIMHEKIMDRLAAEFVKSGHDPKAILRWICNSDAYALRSVANKTNTGSDKVVFFSRQQARPLSRRQLAESLIVALTMEDYAKRRDGLRDEMLRELPPLAPPAMQECELAPLKYEADLSIRQALWLMNGSVFNRESLDPKGTVAKVLKVHGATEKGLPGIITDLFTITLCRAPTPQELKRFTDPNQDHFRGKARPIPATAIRELAHDLFWAMLNSNEFGLNH